MLLELVFLAYWSRYLSCYNNAYKIPITRNFHLFTHVLKQISFRSRHWQITGKLLLIET